MRQPAPPPRAPPLEMDSKDAPPLPRLVHDGESAFCRLWALRWKRHLDGRVEPVPAAAARDGISAVEARPLQLIEADGSVHGGAEAALRALAHAPLKGWMLWLYRRVPGWGRAAEALYGLLARNRPLLSRVTRWTVGPDLAPPTYFRGRWLFLRGLALVAFCAFVSTGLQILGLVGSAGITPLGEQLAGVVREVGHPSYLRFPTLSWWNPSDGFLRLQCWTGAGLAVLLFLGFAPLPALIGMWALWLSVNTAAGDFLLQVGDVILLESLLLAIFWAPRNLLPGLRRETPPSTIGRFLLVYMLFRLMLLCGLTKLLSGDPTWHDLSALLYHFYTQPNPAYLSWFVNLAPAWFHKLSVVLTLLIEVPTPFLVFAPRRLQHFAGVAFAILMVMIWATGTFGWFNLITFALCFVLFDDRSLERVLPARLLGGWPARLVPVRDGLLARARALGMVGVLLFLGSLSTFLFLYRVTRGPGTNFIWPGVEEMPRVVNALRPFRPSGLFSPFARVHPVRKVVVLEGSDDGVHWRPYDFKWQPGRLHVPPRVFRPHMPRLDWHMWFLALEHRGQVQDWYVKFLQRVLEGSPPVLALLGSNPFPGRPPRYLRSSYYDYVYTDYEEWKRTGNFWKRTFSSPYGPDVTLVDGRITIAAATSPRESAGF